MAEENFSRSLDAILVQLGDFGKYQKINFLLICFTVIYSTTMNISYIFTARNVDYRCKIDKCDKEPLDYGPPDWLDNAIPQYSEDAKKCYRFARISTINDTENKETCDASDFDGNTIEKCQEYVYKDQDVTILHDFDLHCDKNLWMLTLVGTVNNLGQMMVLPVGYLSDRYGRRTVLVWGLLVTVIFGVARSLTQSYVWFLVFEFLDQVTAGAAYGSGFILAIELVGPSKRVLTSSIICSCYAIGEILMAVAAMFIPNWRTFLQTTYAPGIMLIAYFWITPESVRWLLVKGRYEEVTAILRTVARVNRRTISEDSLKELTSRSSIETVNRDQSANNEAATNSVPLRDVFKSKIIVLRIINCSFCWITCALVFYGLSLNSVTIAGNIYVNFMASASIEIPAYLGTYVFLDKFGRRKCLCGSLFIAGLACASFLFINQGTWLSICLYLLGKFGATAAFTITYVYTSEMFPTSLRHVLLGFCSTVGRIGSMSAPQMPLLQQIWPPLPLVLFSLLSITSGALVLLFPETLNTKLPDTIEEAENIGKDCLKSNLFLREM